MLEAGAVFQPAERRQAVQLLFGGIGREGTRDRDGQHHQPAGGGARPEEGSGGSEANGRMSIGRLHDFGFSAALDHQIAGKPMLYFGSCFGLASLFQ